MKPHRLSREEARRIALRAQLLDAERPTDVLEVIEHLGAVQVQPAYTMVPSADLVLWSRIGDDYRPEHLAEALEVHRTVFEHEGFVRPTRDLDLYRPAMALAPRYEATRRWLDDNEEFRQDILDLLEAEGPVLARAVPDTSVAPWESSGWTRNKNVQQMLEVLAMRGEIAVSHRDELGRWWDLAERVYPPLRESLDPDEARLRLDQRRFAALGIVNASSPGWRGVRTELLGEPAEIEGVPGLWRVDPAQLGRPFEGRTALLSPFDRLLFDRKRTAALFEFEYLLEMYKPAAKRRWGYFALPILHGDRLVGKLDAAIEQPAGVLRIAAIHEVPTDLEGAVRAELEHLAAWRHLHLVDGRP